MLATNTTEGMSPYIDGNAVVRTSRGIDLQSPSLLRDFKAYTEALSPSLKPMKKSEYAVCRAKRSLDGSMNGSLLDLS